MENIEGVPSEEVKPDPDIPPAFHDHTYSKSLRLADIPGKYEDSYPEESLSSSETVVPQSVVSLKPTNQHKTKCLFKTHLLSNFEDESRSSIDVFSTCSLVKSKAAKELSYDRAKCKTSLHELQTSVRFVRTNDPGPDWESKIEKDNWNSEKKEFYETIMEVLRDDHLKRLTMKESEDYPIHLLNIIELSSQRVRLAFASVFWDTDLIEWLHKLISDSASNEYLVIYLHILQHLRLDLEKQIDSLIENCKWKISTLSPDFWVCLHRKLVEPTTTAVQTLCKVETDPVFVVVPSIGCMSSIKSQNRRHKFFLNQLSNIGKVITLNLQTQDIILDETTPSSYLGFLFNTLKNKIADMSKTHGKRPVVLVGFGIGSLVCTSIAATHKVAAVICLGFCVQTPIGHYGNVEDSISQIQCPILFVVGEMSRISTLDDLEDLRDSLKVESSVVVMGGCNEWLLMSKAKCLEEHVTQSMVDRSICNEVFLFLSSIFDRGSSLKKGLEAARNELFFSSKTARSSHMKTNDDHHSKEEGKSHSGYHPERWKLSDPSRKADTKSKRGRKPGSKNNNVPEKKFKYSTDYSLENIYNPPPPVQSKKSPKRKYEDNEASAAANMLESLLDDNPRSVPPSPHQSSSQETSQQMPISNGIGDILNSDSDSDIESQLFSRSLNEDILGSSLPRREQKPPPKDTKTSKPKKSISSVKLPSVVSHSAMTEKLQRSLKKDVSTKIDVTNFSFSQDILSGSVSDLTQLLVPEDPTAVDIPGYASGMGDEEGSGMSYGMSGHLSEHQTNLKYGSQTEANKMRVVSLSSSGGHGPQSKPTKFVFRNSAKLVTDGMILPAKTDSSFLPQSSKSSSKPDRDHTY